MVNSRKGIYVLFKRFADLAFGIISLFLALPLFLVIGLLIKLDSPGPIIFVQKRVGKHSNVFDIYKFRTMKVETPEDLPSSAITDPDKHLTRIGRFLRRTSIDELPQFVNIIKGDMSIIGPRPVIPNETTLISLRKEMKVDTILPGVTGLAQIQGRDMIDAYTKAKMDAEYMQRMSFTLDVVIFMTTIVKVIKSEHVSH